MKTLKTNRLYLLLIAFCAVEVRAIYSQTFTTLHNFSEDSSLGNRDSQFYAGLLLLGESLYGTTVGDGPDRYGTVFKINTDGTGFTNLFSFNSNDGAYPQAGLVASGGILYGTATQGGSDGRGTVFKLNADGTGFNVLHDFSFGAYTVFPSYTNFDGAYPTAALVVSNNTLYGTAEFGGSSGNGTVFKLNIDGTGFSVLHDFAQVSSVSTFLTNTDGAFPRGLMLSGNTLYGTAQSGGGFGLGTVFAVSTDGSGFRVLHHFDFRDGANPKSKLILLGNQLYGTTSEGSSSDAGTIFAINTNGSDFSSLHFFASVSEGTNIDGVVPEPDLLLSGNALYGVAMYGGTLGNGTVFALSAGNKGFASLFATLHTFTSAYQDTNYNYTNTEGTHPSGFVLGGNTLYGITAGGGSFGGGTVFSLSLLPKLAITYSGPNVILKWPALSSAGFTLESTTNLFSPWTTLQAGPAVRNGQNTITNPTFGTQRFFRLSQ